MELKPDFVKTIKRLTIQNKNEILKNKLCGWIQGKEFTLDDLLYNCVEGNISLSGTILNKMGTLYSLGQEGMMEDTDAAFALFEIAAELGHAGANGNCAQYYFDGRSPEGKKIDLAYYFCKRAIDLGADKYMLMSEILYDQNQYSETVNCLHNIIDKSNQDRKKRVEARDLERQCLVKQLNRVFHKLNTFEEPVSQPLGQGSLPSLDPTLTNLPSPGSSRNQHSASFFASPRTLRSPRTALFTAASSPKRAKSTSAPGSSVQRTPMISVDSFNRMQISSNSPTRNDEVYLANGIASLPGWERITEDIDGFDKNCCTELTAQAEMLELEAHAIRAAWETAQEHVIHAQRNNLSEDIIRLLNDSKVNEFKELYATIVANKDQHIASWLAYTNTQEHILRRQLLTEKAFFNPRTTTNAAVMHLAASLLKRRTKDSMEPVAEPLVLNMAPEKRRADSKILSARGLLTAEKALLDVARAIYLPQQQKQPSVQGNDDSSMCNTLLYTGWTPPPPPVSSSSQLSGNTAGDSGRVSPMRSQSSSNNLKINESTGRENALSRSESPSRACTSGSKGENVRAKATTDPCSVYTAPELLVVDGTHIQYRVCTTFPLLPTNSNVYRSGFNTDGVPSSDEVYLFLNKVTMVAEDPAYVENEKILAQMILRFTHGGHSISLENLRLLNPEVIEEDKEQLDRVCFHYFVRRVVKWLISPTDEAQSYMIPMASVQARTLQLIAAGILTLKEAFDKDGLYGVFYCDEKGVGTHWHLPGESVQHQQHHQYPHLKIHSANHLAATLQHNHHQQQTPQHLHHTTSSSHVPPLVALRNKAKHINALYQKYVVELKQRNFLPTIQYWKEHTMGATVPTYTLLYTELAHCYGGELDDTTDSDTLSAELERQDTFMHALLKKLQR